MISVMDKDFEIMCLLKNDMRKSLVQYGNSLDLHLRRLSCCFQLASDHIKCSGF